MVPAAKAKVVLDTPVAIGIVILMAGIEISPMMLTACLLARALATAWKFRSLVWEKSKSF